MMRAEGSANTDAAVTAHFEALPRLIVDIKSLHHWCYSIGNFVRRTEPRVDVAELCRIALFRHKVIVHYSETQMRSSGRAIGHGTRFGPSFGRVEILGHPWPVPKSFFVRTSREFRRLEAFVPDLRTESNFWERVRLVYKHFNEITDSDLQKWARDTLFGTAGIPSEQPLVVVAALHQVLRDYARVRRYQLLPAHKPDQ
jgi:hypothetical protein